MPGVYEGKGQLSQPTVEYFDRQKDIIIQGNNHINNMLMKNTLSISEVSNTSQFLYVYKVEIMKFSYQLRDIRMVFVII